MGKQPQTYWITGASSGIGEATALEALARGDRVIISARRKDRLERIKEVAPDPERVAIVVFDVADTDTHEETVSRVWEEHGPIDVMVHNAGITQRGLVTETEMHVDRRIMEVNYFGTIALTKALLPYMQERGRGHFTVVTSVAGYLGTPLRSSYCASKHALHGFFNALRAEVHDDGLGVTLICPGYVDTEITLHALQGDGSKMAQRADKQAQGLSPSEVAVTILESTQKNKVEAYPGGFEIVGIYLSRLSPWLTSQIIRRVEST